MTARRRGGSPGRRVGRPRRTLVLGGFAALAVVLLSQGAPARAAGGGSATPATGWFRVEQVGARWTLVDPSGKPFWSLGLNGMNAAGTADRNGRQAYAETVARVYGTPAHWADAQPGRLARWGVNTIGIYSDETFQHRGIPYVVDLGIGEGSVTGPVRDYWDPAWLARAQDRITAAAARYRSDPLLVGYYLDSELNWGRGQLGDLLDGYAAMAAGSPGHRALQQFLQARPGPITAATRRDWAAAVAEQFFAHTAPGLRQADPNHLDLGVGFVAQLTPSEVVAVSGRYVDVESVDWFPIQPKFMALIAQLDRNHEATPTVDTLAAFHQLSGRPVIIASFGFRAADSGLPNTTPVFDVTLATQRERAVAARNLLQCAVASDFIVGAHWWEMTDEPAIGRPDGEDDNWGLVTEQDAEYPAVTGVLHDVSLLAAQRVSAPASLPCRPVEPGPPTTVPPTTLPTTTVPPTTLPTTTLTTANVPASTASPAAASPVARPVAAVPSFAG